MNLIPIPSENCPHCRKKGTECNVAVAEIDSAEMWTIKERQYVKAFKDNLIGRRFDYREGYIFQEYVCSNKGTK